MTIKSDLNHKETANDNNIDEVHPLMRPYHVRLREYQQTRARIFGQNSYSNRKLRSVKRIREYFRQIKMFRKSVISSVVGKDLDNRPYAKLKVNSTIYFALLDSGANTSVIGGNLSSQVQNDSNFRKIKGSVKTADGQRQDVVGTVTLDITFHGQTKLVKFIVVPTIQQDIICGYDFWTVFGLKISTPVIGEIDCTEFDPDKLQLTYEQKQKLERIISMFPNSEIEGLGCTSLIEHSIKTGDAKPIKQRYYPISPAVD